MVQAFLTGQRLQLLLYGGCLAGDLSTASGSRSAIEQTKGFDESFRMAGDYGMWFRLWQLGNVADRHERLVKLREHQARLSHAAGGWGSVPSGKSKDPRPNSQFFAGTHFIRRFMAGSFDGCAP